ncbi:6-phosphogluconolactonase [Oscillatoria sp. FACHB-1406]|uniref:6-phosphogluconolactonase n=1 Tax=Oscillatoria sp. FACHB-1406 TaxID=2692846 RepID=UPI00168267C9|nr:6-phosphogluconolactonase [Oscillatoria sp. FACHB-1406]
MVEPNIFRVDALEVRIYSNSQVLAVAAAQIAKIELQACIAQHGRARVVFATGNSQKEFLEFLTAADGIDWSRVICFHLDEYLGIDPEHSASFQNELRDRVEKRIHPQKFHIRSS